MELDTKMDMIYLRSTSLEGLSSRRWKRVCLHVAIIDGDCMSLKLRVVGLTYSRIAKYNRDISGQYKKGTDRNYQKEKCSSAMRYWWQSFSSYPFTIIVSSLSAMINGSITIPTSSTAMSGSLNEGESCRFNRYLRKIWQWDKGLVGCAATDYSWPRINHHSRGPESV